MRDALPGCVGTLASMAGLAATLVAVACSRPPETCTPRAREALVTFYGQVAGELIAAGACDKHQRIEQCPAYMTLEVQYLAARKGICP